MIYKKAVIIRTSGGYYVQTYNTDDKMNKSEDCPHFDHIRKAKRFIDEVHENKHLPKYRFA